MDIICSDCGKTESDYSSPYCGYCGALLGWPNFRKAKSERPQLRSRFHGALADIQIRKLEHLARELEAVVELCGPVINMPCEACDSLLRGEKYQSYYRRVEMGARLVASESDHGDRAGVNERLYPHYGRYLQYAALSPDGTGIPSYGKIAVRWRADPHYIGKRATLLEENEYTFFERYGLGDRGAKAPLGYRSIWDDRSMLVLAKLAPRMSVATSVAELPAMILDPGTGRNDADYLEVVIYDQGGVDGRDVESVHMDVRLTDPHEQHRWEIVIESCKARGITVL